MRRATRSVGGEQVMRLWLLRPRVWTEENGYVNGLWSPWYDKTFGLVIRAEIEAEARQVAVDTEGEYNAEWAQKAWLDSENSTCVELTADGEKGVVIADVRRA